MYDDLQKLVYNHQITKGDLIDAVNRQLELNKSDFNSQKNNYKNISDIKFIYLNKENELKREISKKEDKKTSNNNFKKNG